jgi:hypothetical protein
MICLCWRLWVPVLPLVLLTQLLPPLTQLMPLHEQLVLVLLLERRQHEEPESAQRAASE